MVALVEFPFMATSSGTIPNRCLSVTKRQPPGHEALHSLRPRRPAFPARLQIFNHPLTSTLTEMHYRLRTLLILLAVGPPSLYVLWLLLQLGMAINAIVEVCACGRRKAAV